MHSSSRAGGITRHETGEHRGFACNTIARDAAESRYSVIVRRLHFALLLVLIGSALAPVRGATPATVSGVVRDASGAPQIGAIVQLLRPNLGLVASAYTNSKGRFSFRAVLPGRYSVKAMGTSFLPSLRENVRVNANTVVNLTLNTLYEVMQWLPAEPRSANAQSDDWTWTLRSAANRPLLRWLEDGPLVMVSDGPNSAAKLKARLIATGQQGSFGEDGRRIAVEVEDTPSTSRELLASVDFAPGSDARMESMLGFRQDLGYAGSVQSLAAVSIHPEMDGAGAEGLQEAALRTWQSMRMGDEFELEAGAEQVVARFAQGSPNTVFAVLPFLSFAARTGDSSLNYRMSTAVPGTRSAGEAQAAMWLPALSVRRGSLLLEHGMHQEVAWERNTDASGMTVLLYSDTLVNPTLEAMVRGQGNGSDIPANSLYDSSSGILRTAAPGYSTMGVAASYEHRLSNGNSIRLSYANGDALALQPSARALALAQIIEKARPRRTQMYSLALSGTLDGTGTRWRASYRWQPEDTVTRVASYNSDASEPYLNLHLRQPVRLRREGVKGLDAMLDLRNILAQGDRSFLLSDGSLLVFAQDQRSVSAGLAFTF